MDILDEYWLEELLSENFPYDRLPTTEECFFAIEYPATAEPWVKEYLRRRPGYEQFLRSCLGLERDPLNLP